MWRCPLTRRTTGNSQVNALNDELRAMKGQLDDLQSAIRKHEATISAKERQIDELENAKAAGVKASQDADQIRSTLQVRIDTLLATLADRDREKKDAGDARQKLERELDGLRKVMADKSSEDIKRREADKSREAEMARLREQVVAVEKAREEQKKAHGDAISSLRVTVEGLQGKHKATDKDLKTTVAALKAKEDELVRVRVELDRSDEKRRAADMELKTVRGHIVSVETELRSTIQARDVSDRFS